MGAVCDSEARGRAGWRRGRPAEGTGVPVASVGLDNGANAARLAIRILSLPPG